MNLKKSLMGNIWKYMLMFKTNYQPYRIKQMVWSYMSAPHAEWAIDCITSD